MVEIQNKSVESEYHTSAVNYRKVLDSAIARAQSRGYRIADKQLFDFRYRTCDPIGAVMAFSNTTLDKDFARVFMAAFDGEVHELANYNPVAHELGKEYRERFLLG